MRIGVVFPQTEIGIGPAAIRNYAQTVERLGFTYVLTYDHVLGANPNRPGGWSRPYTFQTPFYEVFVLFSYLAEITSRLKLVTGILILAAAADNGRQPWSPNRLPRWTCCAAASWAGCWAGMERDRICRPERKLSQPRQSHRGTGGVLAPVVG